MHKFPAILAVICLGACQAAVHLPVKGTVYLPGTQGYQDAFSASWNSRASTRKPAMFVYVTDESDIITCINYGIQNGLKITVRGGGHSLRSTVDGAMVIDTSNINHIEIDDDNQTVRLGAGCEIGAVYSALQEKGLGIPAGTNGDVGIVGLSLLGGQGYLTRKYGLLVDNVVSYRMVTLAGSVC